MGMSPTAHRGTPNSFSRPSDRFSRRRGSAEGLVAWTTGPRALSSASELLRKCCVYPTPTRCRPDLGDSCWAVVRRSRGWANDANVRARNGHLWTAGHTAAPLPARRLSCGARMVARTTDDAPRLLGPSSRPGGVVPHIPQEVAAARSRFRQSSVERRMVHRTGRDARSLRDLRRRSHESLGLLQPAVQRPIAPADGLPAHGRLRAARAMQRTGRRRRRWQWTHRRLVRSGFHSGQVHHVWILRCLAVVRCNGSMMRVAVPVCELEAVACEQSPVLLVDEFEVTGSHFGGNALERRRCRGIGARTKQ
jgi:hypothetical protein